MIYQDSEKEIEKKKKRRRKSKKRKKAILSFSLTYILSIIPRKLKNFKYHKTVAEIFCIFLKKVCQDETF
uniref:Uncharacterized protein n=1 Tax=Strongyloides papillosus TaxID=174720 RepID=A0A0N5CAE6_STREA